MLETTRANNFRFGSIGFLAGAAAVLAAVAIILYAPPDTDSQAESNEASTQTQVTENIVPQVSDAPTVAGSEQSHDTGRHPLVLSEHAATVTAEESTFHEAISTQPLADDNLRFAEQFLATARAETAKYQDVAVARGEGYFQITQDLPLIGAHFFKPSNVGSLEPGRPAQLLYEDDGAGGWRLVGMLYQLPKDPTSEVPPTTPFGPLANWHYHTDLCFTSAGVTISDPAGCGGVFVPETDWLLHVWAWKDSPEGVFNHANSLLQ